MNILILGKNSFLFLNLIRHLEQKNNLFFVNEKSFFSQNFKEKLIVKTNNLKIDCVINFISDNDNDFKNKNFLKSFSSNVFINLCIIELLISNRINCNLILFSSYEIYKTKSMSIYSLNKLYLEYLFKIANNNFKEKKIKLVRLNSVIGPYDKNQERLVPSTLHNLKINKKLKNLNKYHNFVLINELVEKFIPFIFNNKKILVLQGKKININTILKYLQNIHLKKNFRKNNKSLFIELKKIYDIYFT